MMTRKDFFDAFQKMMTHEMSTAEFARQAVQYMKSPDYRRYQAEKGAEDLRRWREGRAYLMALIEDEKKAGTDIDYQTLPLREGHDSIKVIVNGRPTVCFPSFFHKDFVDMNWTHVLEGKARPRRACGREDCGTSTAIDDETLTFGQGNLDDQGYWEVPCRVCAAAFEKRTPGRPVWPASDAPE